ncbi:MAG: bifunctional histidine phosphatase family protein/GNAT family N-acetyltransferase [Pseudoflavonifractor sp.]
MTRIYVIRHAEAEGNLYRRIQGWYNSLITQRGYRQIAALEGRFEHEQIDAVYSSDLFRTMTTAGAIYKSHGLPLITRPDLREIHLGVWEDCPWGSVAYDNPERMTLFNASSEDWSVENGETFRQVGARVSAAVLAIAAENPDRTVAVFSHGMAIRTLQGTLMGLPPEGWKQLGHGDNTAVTCIEVEGGKATLLYCNDNSHLPEEISTLASQNWWKSKEGFHADRNLRYAPLDMDRDGEIYYKARREAWVNIHGSLLNFDGDGFVQDAVRQCRQDRRAVTCAYLRDELVGLIQMDITRDAEQGIGYIPFVYMLPEYRKQGLGVQLLGEAISLYRPLGRDKLHLRCAPDNLVAQRFYRRYGFQKIAEVQGSRVPLDMMEKYIGFRSN